MNQIAEKKQDKKVLRQQIQSFASVVGVSITDNKKQTVSKYKTYKKLPFIQICISKKNIKQTNTSHMWGCLQPQDLRVGAFIHGSQQLS